MDTSFTPPKLPIQDVFEAIKGQPWVKHPEVKPHDATRLGAKDYYSFHDCKGHQTSQCWSLSKYLKDLVQEGYPWEYVLTPEASSETERQLETPSLLDLNTWSLSTCHAPLPKIRWSGDETRVGDAYMQEKYLMYTR